MWHILNNAYSICVNIGCVALFGAQSESDNTAKQSLTRSSSSSLSQESPFFDSTESYFEGNSERLADMVFTDELDSYDEFQKMIDEIPRYIAEINSFKVDFQKEKDKLDETNLVKGESINYKQKLLLHKFEYALEELNGIIKKIDTSLQKFTHIKFTDPCAVHKFFENKDQNQENKEDCPIVAELEDLIISLQEKLNELEGEFGNKLLIGFSTNLNSRIPEFREASASDIEDDQTTCKSTLSF
jgi:hypothetical protein